MPCSKYKGAQRNLCYATNEWKDFSKIRKKGLANADKKTRTRVARAGGKKSRRR